MATRQYDMDTKDEFFEVTESVGGAISNDVRITVDMATVSEKKQFVLALEKLKLHILEDTWPPV